MATFCMNSIKHTDYVTGMLVLAWFKKCRQLTVLSCNFSSNKQKITSYMRPTSIHLLSTLLREPINVCVH
jgi:hypothetical protein